MSSGGIVFTDLVGSTTMYDRLGDAEAERLRRDHFAVLRSVVDRHRGAVVKSTGDGLMVLFRAPADAVDAAVAMQRAVASAEAARLQLRVGGHAGDFVEDDGDFYGLTVNIARRLCDAAASNQILVSDALRALSSRSPATPFAPVGELTLKGVSAPIPAFDVLWHDGGAARASTLPPAIARVAARAFAGRDVAVESIERALGGERHEPLLCLVEGEPGIGKTRLVAEVASRAVDRGALVLYGRSDEDGIGAYQPFVDVLRQAAAAGVAVSPLLQRLLPFRTGDATDELQPGLENRAAVFAGFEQLFSQLEAAHDVLIVLDDLHWADDASLALLKHLLRTPSATSLAFLAAFRDTELDPRHPLPHLIADVRTDVTLQRVALGGLTPADIEALLHDAGLRADVAPSDVGTLAETVAAETGGNALFVQELIRHLQESSSGTPSGPPAGVREVIRRRLSRLSPAAVDVLQVAGVTGRTFSIPVVADVAGSTALDVADLVDEAVDARLLEPVAGRVDELTFSHALVRDAIVDDLPRGRRRRLHARAGDALARRGGDPSEVAHQFLEAREATRPHNAAAWALLVAQIRHWRLGDHEAAVAFATAGIEALTAVGDRNSLRLRIDLLTVRCDAACSLGRFSDALTDAATAVDDAVSAGDVRRAARVAAIAGRSAGPETLPLLDRVIAVAGDDAVVRARIEPIRCFFLPSSKERTRLAMESLRVGWEHDDPEAITYAALAAADCMFATATARERLDLLHRAIEIGRRLDDVAVVPFSARLAGTYLELGDRDLARATTAEATRVARLQGAEMWTALLLAADRLHTFLDGDLDRVIADLGPHTSDEVGGFYAAALMMLAIRERGGGASTVPLLEPLTTDARTQTAVRAALGLLYAESGRPAEARDAIAGVLPDLTYDRGRVVALAMCVEAAATIGDARLAERAAKDLSAWSGCAVVSQSSLCLGAADRYLGMAALAASDAATAVALLERAVVFDRDRLASPLFTAHSSIWLARSLAARGEGGDVERAAALLESAETSARAMDAQLVLGFVAAARSTL